ncbi:type II toxin-antitoxin system MqsA family antitoxin [Mariprofundus ferrooxydans]|uniref:type II toxin-antitoxin system MqsA family antitoxin n=1 Tax=Mariprofundus ferrooxydans TaxID=314344 RepID=UPI0006A70207|nr:type II toxin-antitoxin system MqsA family antitoxin [Mariprofundus ferrooxydans]
MKSIKICPICDEGNLSVHYENNPVEYKSVTELVNMAICLCDSCGSESAGKDEMRHNKRALLAFRKSVDGLLSEEQVKKIRQKYRLTQSLAGKLFGGGPVAFNKYEHNEVAQSEAMDGLLRLVAMNEDAYWDLVQIKGMTRDLAPQYKTNVYVAYPEQDFISSTYQVGAITFVGGSRGLAAKVLHYVKSANDLINNNGWKRAVNYG